MLAQTKDHTRVQQLIDQGACEEAFAAHPGATSFNCLGSHRPPR
jgi:hypothetical protein